MKRWYLIRSKHRNEVLLWHQLCSRCIEAYYPRISTQDAEPSAARVRPYFGGYMFVHIDLDTHIQSALKWMPGAAGFVYFGGEPAYVPDEIVHEMQRRANRTDRYECGELPPGPFAGYEGMFDIRRSERERTILFLRFIRGLQTCRDLPVSYDLLIASSSHFPARYARPSIHRKARLRVRGYKPAVRTTAVTAAPRRDERRELYATEEAQREVNRSSESS